MGLETEHKFLLKNSGWKKFVTSSMPIIQGYFAVSGATVRVRIAGENAFLTIKGKSSSDFTRSEFEYPIPVADARKMLDEFCGTRIVEKVRHIVPAENGLVWEIDEYSALNAGLFTAEIELPCAGVCYHTPEWLGMDVSDAPEYSNGALSRNPYTLWGKQ